MSQSFRFFAAALCCALALPFAASAQAPLSEPVERINDFRVTASLESDRALTVTETIAYDFGGNARHGIYRSIPVSYQRNGGTYRLRLSLIRVTMDGVSVPYRVESRSPEFRVYIGDPDATITGVHIYMISYATDRAINFFDGEGELYWNVTGNAWKIPIKNASFSLTGPEAYDAVAGSRICYTGPLGSTAENCTTHAEGNAVRAETTWSSKPGEGLTVVLRFPKGVIAEPTWPEKISMLIADNGILVIPLLVFVFMFWRWRAFGRDPKGRGTVVPQYEPPRNLAPMEMQALMKQEIAASAVTATILDLARRGYLKIEFGEEKGIFGSSQTYAFRRMKAADETLAALERTLYDGIFSSGADNVTLDVLKGKLYRSITRAKSQAFAALREQGLFGRNPYTVRAAYFGAAGIVAFLGFMAQPVFGALGIGALLASAAIIAVFGWLMPSKTKEGAIALEEVEGFKWFLSVTEKDRLAFHNAPTVKPEQFHAFLPAAIAFGVEEQWAKQFAGLDIPEPTYASGYGVWNALVFTHVLHSFNTAAAASIYVPPQGAGAGRSGFGGGGFSGGGFGGGGGGSW